MGLLSPICKVSPAGAGWGGVGGRNLTRKGINLPAFCNLCKQLSASSFGFLVRIFFPADCYEWLPPSSRPAWDFSWSCAV